MRLSRIARLASVRDDRDIFHLSSEKASAMPKSFFKDIFHSMSLYR